MPDIDVGTERSMYQRQRGGATGLFFFNVQILVHASLVVVIVRFAYLMEAQLFHLRGLQHYDT